jgi:hypothetical protein
MSFGEIGLGLESIRQKVATTALSEELWPLLHQKFVTLSSCYWSGPQALSTALDSKLFQQLLIS